MSKHEGEMDKAVTDTLQDGVADPNGKIDYSFLGLSDDEAEKMRGLEEAARLEADFSPEVLDQQIPLPGREETDWIVLRRVDSFQSRHWRKQVSDMRYKTSLSDDDDEEDRSMEGSIVTNLAGSYLYLCQIGIERYQITSPNGQVQRGGYSRKMDGASELGNIAKETRAVFGALPPGLGDWVERVLLMFNGLTKERRTARNESQA